MEDALEWFPGGAAGAAMMAGAVALGTYYAATRQKGSPPMFPLDEQAFLEYEGTEMIRTSRFGKDAKDGTFLRYLFEDCRTLYDCFRRGAKESNNGICLGWRETKNKPYQWLHYNEALLRAKNFGCGLVHMGLHPGSYVGIYSINCPEWILTEQGLYCYSMVIVPLYDTLGADACAFIINQAEMTTVICDDDAKINLLLDKAPKCLVRLVHIKPLKPETIARAKKQAIELLRFEEVEKLGSTYSHSHREKPPRPDDISTICYTSGTTGNPKGVMLSHENIVADVSAVLLQMGEHRPCRQDTMISFLPLAHMLERCCQVAMYMQGGAVGFYAGDIRNLMEDMKALKPTVTPAVPRLLNRIHDKVMGNVNGSVVKRAMLRMAINSKMTELQKGIMRKNSIWDTLIFRKVQEGMGGRLRLIVVGSAPLSGQVLTFMRCAMGCVVVEGYGQTECVAPCTLTIQGDVSPEHVGPPLACCCIKLVDVPEMEYYASAGQGEVCVKGTSVFKGYYKDPERTRTVIDKDGWLHTGDIGTWLPNGTLKIIDRKKHIFKLSQGEYIAPEKLENIYSQSQYVAQVFVYGESLKSCVVAIVVPDVETVKIWASANEIPGTLSVLCADDRVKALLLEDITRLGKQAHLKSFEQVKDIYLHPDPFSVQNGLLTPTMKAKRPQLKAYFKPQLDDMYSKLN
ncbi:long-chain-fatty-acid--CoA ligase 1 isoform X2 [Folsomia candida]|nr:long-chain-fatty-acid--CoA ligase 1 isoform X2 [Folsomia candida]XP_035709795.1 long-chain-fatty-acid--CoA ligase 1 isoform X2 [Folsomia candida]XP_035709796.1 long-chain-fatty-acid--CoA ligase 1 isoform X2 [Folsomia candida]XP_035709797.1 long-chain-fatty-acid--CoA ligase 1 isoform X2 [Folsomia candida]